MENMNHDQSEYRNLLISMEQKSQEAYDKTIVSLSGGALGLTLIFITNVIGTKDPIYVAALVLAWASWALSILAVVFSYLTSQQALSRTIEQCDKGDYSGGVGGQATVYVRRLNFASGTLFALGVVCIIIFCAANIGGTQVNEQSIQCQDGKKGQTPPPPPPPRNPGGPSTGYIPPPPAPTPPSPAKNASAGS